MLNCNQAVYKKDLKDYYKVVTIEEYLEKHFYKADD